MDVVQIPQQAPQSAWRIGGLLVGKYGHRPRNPVEQELLDVRLVPQSQPAVRRTEMAVVQRGFDDERIGVDPVPSGPLFEPVDKKTTNRLVLVLLRGIEDHPHGFPLLSFAGLCLVAHATGRDEQAGPRAATNKPVPEPTGRREEVRPRCRGCSPHTRTGSPCRPPVRRTAPDASRCERNNRRRQGGRHPGGREGVKAGEEA